MAATLTSPARASIGCETNLAGHKDKTNFYTQLFGWPATDVEMGPLGSYAMFQQAGPHLGGIVRVKGCDWDGLPPQWALYVQVDNVDYRARMAVDFGGQIGVPPFDIPNTGRACVVIDPEGASFYLFAPRND